MSDLILNKYTKLPKEIQEKVLEYIEYLTFKYKLSGEPPSDTTSNFGSAKGLIEIGDDFDDPIDDFKAYCQ